jgi:hypothetical protein
MAKTNYLEDQIIAHIFRTGTFTKPSALYFALVTALGDDATPGTEVVGGSYARVQRDPLDANWTAPTGGDGQTDNAAAATFPAPTANWGTIVGVEIWDGPTGGANRLYHGALTTPRTVNNGDPAPLFDIGALVLQES